MVKENESQEREMIRQRDHQLLFDMVADLQEEVLKRKRLHALEASHSREQLSQASLAWLYCVCVRNSTLGRHKS
jgi:hypothetical protein